MNISSGRHPSRWSVYSAGSTLLSERSSGSQKMMTVSCLVVFFSSRRRHTRCSRDWSSDVCSSDLKMNRNPVRLCVAAILYGYTWFTFMPASAAQLVSFPKQELVDYSAQNPFDRLADGDRKSVV